MRTKKIISALALLGMMPSLVGAQTTTTPSQQVQTLLQQIQSLQQQIANLQQQKQQTMLQLSATLREGSEGDNVKILQALLAADPSIYPEGLITGFFGKATGRAVKRFQEKNGLEGVGFVGPRTLKKLNELMEKNQLAFEDDDAKTNKAVAAVQKAMDKDAKDALKTVKKLCAKVPPGHTIAPGWLRKNEGKQPLIPLCQHLPTGIINNPNWPQPTTSTSDIVSSVISNIAATVSAATASVTWNTNEAATTQVAYGTSSAYGMEAPLVTTLVLSHAQTLSGLLPLTTYHYQVRSKDAVGNLATSSDQVFTTLAAPDTTPPVIASVSVVPVSTGATIAWTTNENATSKVYYGTASPLVPNATGTLSVSDATLITNHSMNLLGLTTSTTYFYQVESGDGAGNKATSTGSFTTLAS